MTDATLPPEPEHAPSITTDVARSRAVQPHGALIIVRVADLCAMWVSANAKEWFDIEASALIGRKLDDIIERGDATRLLARAAVGDQSLRPGVVTLRSGARRQTHVFAVAEGMVGVEFSASLDSGGTTASTISRISQWSEDFHRSTTVDELAQRATEAIRGLTTFDRVWIMRLGLGDTGQVIAESVRDGEPSSVGLYFPPPAFPEDERFGVARNPATFLADTAADIVPLVGVASADPGELDLTASTIRAAPAILGTLLSDYGVKGGALITLAADDAAWGLVIAHHLSGPMPVSIEVQAELRLMATAFEQRLAQIVELGRGRRRLENASTTARLLDRVAETGDVVDAMLAEPQALLDLCDANGAVVSIGGRLERVGADDFDDRQARALVEMARAYLGGVDERGVAAVESIIEDHPGADELAPRASGLLAARFTRDDADLVVWFRGEMQREITWGGGVTDDGYGDYRGGGQERRVEAVRNRSEPWTAAELASVIDFRAALGALMITSVQQMARVNEELRRSNEEFDAFAHAAAHDLKQPVRGITQYTEFLLEDIDDRLSAAEREQMETVLRLAGRMNQLLADLMTYAEIGGTDWSRTRVELPTVVAEVMELLPPQATHAVSLDVAPTVLQADESALRQLLLNLIGNAIKYSGDAPHIAVGTVRLAEVLTPPPESVGELDDSTTVLFVSDDGPGIAPDYHTSIFTLFRRLSASQDGSSGAGLALCRRIARRQGGDIWVHSVPGEGATFYVVLDGAGG